jgi:hypothetical protein
MKGLLYVGGPLDGRYTPDLGDGTAYRSVILALKDGLNFQFMAHSSLVTSAQMIDALVNPAKVRMDDDPLCRVCGCSKSVHDVKMQNVSGTFYGMVRVTVPGQKIFHYFEAAR